MKSGNEDVTGPENLSGELIPVIFQVAGPEKLFSEFIR